MTPGRPAIPGPVVRCQGCRYHTESYHHRLPASYHHITSRRIVNGGLSYLCPRQYAQVDRISNWAWTS
jgi:hypothetical protein